jgi:hypothetical protein
MRNTILAVLAATILLALPASATAAPDSGVTPAPVPGLSVPTTRSSTEDAGKGLVSALWARRWWFAAAAGIFLAIGLAGLLGLWGRIGTFWAWLAVGVLSFAAGLFAAVDARGLHWETLLAYLTAGPTIAWARDWIKDGVPRLKSPAPGLPNRFAPTPGSSQR